MFEMFSFQNLEDIEHLWAKRGPYGNVISWGLRTELMTKERDLFKKTEGKHFQIRTEQRRLTRNLLCGVLVGFLSHF